MDLIAPKPAPTVAVRAPDPDHRHPALPHARIWLFDLDNTLYSHECKLIDQVDRLIGQYIVDFLKITPEAAHALRKDYLVRYGTTMRGLVAEHGVNSNHYMDYVHHIDMTAVPPSPELDAVLGKLEGPKYVFTNATVAHSDRVLERLGVTHHFDGIFDIAAADFNPKPLDAFYDVCTARFGIDPRSAVLFEDTARNLKPAHERGMTTVHLKTAFPHAMEGHDEPWVHHSIDDLVGWLNKVVRARDR